MDRIESILVAIDHNGGSRQVAKAAALARRFHARLELFLCNAESAYVQRHQYYADGTAAANQSSIAESRCYLEALWKSLSIDDVPVTMDAAFESPRYEGIVHKVQRSAPDLVIRSIGEHGGAGGALDASDWELVRTCPTPLILMRGRPWKARPAVAAAVDISGDEAPELTRSILIAGERFATACHGSLEVLYAGRLEAAAKAAERYRAVLASRAKEAGARPAELHVIDGDPAAAMPRFAAERYYDLFVLGALTHRKALTALVGTLTGRLIETLDSDFLLVKPPAYRCPV